MERRLVPPTRHDPRRSPAALTADAELVEYRITIAPEGSGDDHWLVVDMIRSSGAVFDTHHASWVVRLPVTIEPLLAEGRLGEALLGRRISIEPVRTIDVRDATRSQALRT